jgi:hypothetical protein
MLKVTVRWKLQDGWFTRFEVENSNLGIFINTLFTSREIIAIDIRE